ncbi:TIGR03792 family protein [Oculatella sp. FACHB-28]|uniref:TIGR03792 family protein n=1 Tax=Cyanophyceae TaxID=3028117 RepID=UPI0016837A09|nr:MULTISPECIES: TIGR03792 family protein [Cyanophyceae]MBD2000577.1 TIGR03792 family protein [Leptolyngbya sp. FACHB-541]MBD2059238.1 TIGR03792 family protein [Oculatella sp. FACHB-28]
MVIEWLKFNVTPELREQFVQKDEEIWTAALSTYPGFLGKEVWISPDNLAEVIIIVRWSSFEEWQSISPEELEQIEARFNAAIGEDTHEIVESAGYQVRKFQRS